MSQSVGGAVTRVALGTAAVGVAVALRRRPVLSATLTATGRVLLSGGVNQLRQSGGVLAPPPSAAQIRRFSGIVNRLCTDQQISYPIAEVVADPVPNMVIRYSPDGTWVLRATTGMLQLASDAELRACAAHELSHMTHRDSRTLLPLTASVNALRLGRDMAVSRALLTRRVVTPAVVISSAALLAARLGSEAASRQIEARADRDALGTSADPAALESLLRKLESAVPRRLDGLRQVAAGHAVAERAIDSIASGLDRGLSGHRPTSQRIVAIRRAAGLG